MSDETSDPPQGRLPTRLLYHWIKSTLFRVVHADGAWGGISPRGTLHFAVYNERNAIPQVTSRPIKQIGESFEAGAETTVAAREGLVREIEVEVIMDYQTAVEFHQWLTTKIDQLRQINLEVSKLNRKKS
jgi:hypothetical protein